MGAVTLGAKSMVLDNEGSLHISPPFPLFTYLSSPTRSLRRYNPLRKELVNSIRLQVVVRLVFTSLRRSLTISVLSWLLRAFAVPRNALPLGSWTRLYTCRKAGSLRPNLLHPACPPPIGDLIKILQSLMNSNGMGRLSRMARRHNWKHPKESEPTLPINRESLHSCVPKLRSIKLLCKNCELASFVQALRLQISVVLWCSWKWHWQI